MLLLLSQITMLPQIPAITPFRKEELLRELDAIVRECVDFGRRTPEAHFDVRMNGKWSQAQQIDHLIRAAKPLVFGFRLPKIAPRLLFGKSNRPSRTFQELVEKYQQGLERGGKASAAFIPPHIEAKHKAALLQKYEQIHVQLAQSLASWQEQDLEDYLMPHPIIGKLTVREMLMFTVYHNYHHLAAMREHSAAKTA